MAEIKKAIKSTLKEVKNKIYYRDIYKNIDISKKVCYFGKLTIFDSRWGRLFNLSLINVETHQKICIYLDLNSNYVRIYQKYLIYIGTCLCVLNF